MSTDHSTLASLEALPPDSSLEFFLEKNKKSIVLLFVILVLAVITFVVFRSIKEGHETSAGEALSHASSLEELQKLSAKYPETAAAGSAQLLIADYQWANRQQDEAIKTLRDFLREKPTHAAVPLAQSSLGSKFMEQKKSAEAVELFDKVLANPATNFLNPYALSSLGDLAKEGGDMAKADNFYDRAANENAGNPLSQEASMRVKLLKAAPPVEIAAPVAVPPPASPPGATGFPAGSNSQE